MAKNKEKTEKRVKLTEEQRTVDLLERIGAASLYINTSLGQTDVARILGMDNNRINEILKGVKKENRTFSREKR